jgi:hypothetical protein
MTTRIPVDLTLDQLYLVRGMLATTTIQGQLLPPFQELKDVLDAAEERALITHNEYECMHYDDGCRCLCSDCKP